MRGAETAYGKVIQAVTLVEGSALDIQFTDGYVLTLRDTQVSCCESRYMHTDDEFSPYVGATLLEVRIEEGPTEEPSADEVEESEFLIVSTSAGAFTVVTHNDHNGYYGGFNIEATVRKGE